jgi:hypothetical protein
MGSISVDVVRTHQIVKSLPQENQESQEHFRRLERILFVFGMTPPEYGYVQGFNELAGVLYYAIVVGFVGDRCALDVCEALAFWAFDHLMSIRDGDRDRGQLALFVEVPERRAGIDAFLSAFEAQLRLALPQAAEILKHHELRPPYYGVRWFQLLFAQDWELQSVLTIWDCLLCNDGLEFGTYLQCLGIAHVELRKTELSKTDFGKTLEVMQRKCTGALEVRQMLGLAERRFQLHRSRALASSPRRTNSDPGWFARSFLGKLFGLNDGGGGEANG